VQHGRGGAPLPTAAAKYAATGDAARAMYGTIAMDAHTRHKQFMALYRQATQPPPVGACVRASACASMFAARVVNRRADLCLCPPQAFKTDADVLREEHRFLREDEADPAAWSEYEYACSGAWALASAWISVSVFVVVRSWGKRMALRYYQRLHKHYALADLSRWALGSPDVCTWHAAAWE
jgi:hypothetical protein